MTAGDFSVGLCNDLKYRIIFKIIDSRVIILRVLHNARMLNTEML
ncbi:MAG: hypothetical protein Q7V05_14895 [Methanoregula sp.]|nr:hypothetical protein [Methanoregula sp.]